MVALWKRYKGSYFSYVLIFFFFYFCMAVFSSVLSVYLTGLGMTASQMSLVVSAAGLFSFFMVPLVGYLYDRVSKPRALSAAIVLGAGVLGLVFSRSRSVWVLFLLDGLIMSLINSQMPVCERMAGASRYRYGTLRVWGTFGYAAGAQGAGLAMEHVGPGFIFVLLFFGTLLSLLGFAGWENTPVSGQEVSQQQQQRPRVSEVVKNPSFLLFLLIACLFTGSCGVNNNYAPMLLTSLGVAPSAVGTVLLLSTLVEIPLILFSHKFMDRFSGKVLILWSFGVMLLQYLCYGLFPSPLVVVAAMVLLKAIASTMFVMINLKVVRNLIDPRLTTTGLAVINAATSAAGILLQNAGGLLVDASSIPTLYLALCGLAGVGLVLTLFLRVANRERVFS